MIDEIKRAIHIHGPDVAGMKGKITRRRPEPISLIDNIPMPLEIYEQHRNKMVSVDYVYVHGINHLHYTSRGYGFRTIEYVSGEKARKKDSKKGLKKTLKVFKDRGICIT